jgi:Stage II sporulation protein E (SpoIIE)
MRRLLLLFLAAAPALAAQSAMTVLPQQCVWRAGDDPAWAAPNFDDTAWQPYAQWKPQGGQVYLWVRCHADLGFLRSVVSPALQVRAYSAYELYLNGQKIGTAGNLANGNFSMNAMRTFAVPGAQPPAGTSTIALRLVRRSLVSSGSPSLMALPANAEIRAGDASILDALRASTVLAQSSRYLESAIGFGVVAVIAVLLLGLYLYDRRRIELLLLSIVCLSISTIRLNEFGVASLLDYSFSTCVLLIYLGNVGYAVARIPFFFRLAGRRVPLFFWILTALSVLGFSPGLLHFFLGIHEPAWLAAFSVAMLQRFVTPVLITTLITPFVAFWPYSRLAPRMRPLAVLSMFWQAADLFWFIVIFSALGVPGLPNLYARWGARALEVRAIVTELVLASLLALLFREQRQVTQQRAMLEGEMRAARAVQQVIVPAENPEIPGFTIDSVYRPASEVGGDFFQVIAAKGGGVLAVIGDVSGKGMPAAMTVSLLVGTLRTLAHYTQSPGEILAAMNQRMLGRSQGGFTTCLVVRADAAGRATVANAGHLAPYVDGKEFAIKGGLPLGLEAHTVYKESEFELRPGALLTLLSDGVVEARNSSGELFGFERTAAIAGEPAESIAGAAQAFGQEDDITVLTLRFASAGVLDA